MKVAAVAKALVLVQLSLLCFAVFGEEIDSAVAPSQPPSHPHDHGAHAPSPHHHHHHHHHHGHPPSAAPHPPPRAPAYPPKPISPPPAHPPKPSTPPPAHPPVHYPPPKPQPQPQPQPPVKPPTFHFPRSFVAVQGVVFCKSCKYPGVDTLLGATPVLGATVKLQCNNTKYKTEVKATTDKNGYFFLQAPKTITNYGAHKCRAFLVSSPNTACSKPSNLHGGVTGAILRPEKPYFANKLPFVLFSVGPFAFEPKCPK